MIALMASPNTVPLSVPIFIIALSLAPGVGIAVSAASVRYDDNFVLRLSLYLCNSTSVTFFNFLFLVRLASLKAPACSTEASTSSTADGTK